MHTQIHIWGELWLNIFTHLLSFACLLTEFFLTYMVTNPLSAESFTDVSTFSFILNVLLCISFVGMQKLSLFVCLLLYAILCVSFCLSIQYSRSIIPKVIIQPKVSTFSFFVFRVFVVFYPFCSDFYIRWEVNFQFNSAIHRYQVLPIPFIKKNLPFSMLLVSLSNRKWTYFFLLFCSII